MQRYADLYDLTSEKLLTLERMGKKSGDNLLAGVQASKTRGLESLINGLSIRHVGNRVATGRAENFGSIAGIAQFLTSKRGTNESPS